MFGLGRLRIRLPKIRLPKPVVARLARLKGAVRRIGLTDLRLPRIRLPGRRALPLPVVKFGEALPWVVGGLAGIAGLVGAVTAIRSESAWGVPLGLSLHGVGVVLSWLAGRFRRRGDLSGAETDIVLTSALFVPGLGPAVAWALPRASAKEAVENAHEVIERYKAHVKPVVPDYERSLFTGDRDRDLARKLDAESFREVLRHGDTDQKRSALFRLAELGSPHHIELIRNCLVDDDGEVRLYAYGELDRLTRVHEDEIAKARRAVAANDRDVAAHLRMSRAHFDLAASGVLDPRTAGFHFRAAATEAQIARNLAAGEVEPLLAEARSFAHLGDLQSAEHCMEEVPDERQDDPEVCLVRAEVAFKRRDFDTARREAGRLLLTETELPGWLQAICMTPEGRVLGEFEDKLNEIREEGS